MSLYMMNKTLHGSTRLMAERQTQTKNLWATVTYKCKKSSKSLVKETEAEHQNVCRFKEEPLCVSLQVTIMSLTTECTGVTLKQSCS